MHRKIKKTRLLLLLILLSTSCKETKQKDTSYFKTVQSFNKNNSLTVPVLKINKKEFTKIKNPYFNHSVGGKPIKEKTVVLMKYDRDFLEIVFECKNNPRVHQNYFTEDNSAMFTQETFEIFISKGADAQENYLEIQLNPNNALFLGKVMYRYKTDNKYALEYIDTKTTNVVHTVEKDIKNNLWKGYLKLPLALLQYPKPTPDQIYRLNIYRIISQVDHLNNKNWSSNAKNSTFACWSSTMAKQPQFHVPEYFGFLMLD